MLQSNNLEEYLTRKSQPNGRALKAHAKAAARSAADEFLRGGKSIPNRQHYRMCLIGAGVDKEEATNIATDE